jgi:polysaccharide export outer membrane protein
MSDVRPWTICVLALAGVLMTPRIGSAQTSTESGLTARDGAPPSYQVGPEDVIGVLVWHEPDMSGDFTVRPDGKISLPLIGDLQAAGRTPEQLSNDIDQAAARYVEQPSVSVVLRQLNSRKVFITGQVKESGSFPLAAPRTVLQLIALAGGLTEYADADHITVMRTEEGQTKIFKFNYKDVAKGQHLEQNIQLLPGDTVVVP